MIPFRDVIWQDLLVVSYVLNPQYVGCLEALLPADTELDDYNGKHYVSVVAFRFRKTRILGMPMPLYRDFPEINLRFYVRRKVNGEWRRGVVFIKEIIPHKLPAMIANGVFRENFHIHPLVCEKVSDRISYTWDIEGQEQSMQVRLGNYMSRPEPGTLEEHIIEHYWAYKGLGENKTAEFQVTHRPWQICLCEDTDIQLDIGRIYGNEWEQMLSERPVNIFYADGSRVGVTLPKKIQP